MSPAPPKIKKQNKNKRSLMEKGQIMLPKTLKQLFPIQLFISLCQRCHINSISSQYIKANQQTKPFKVV